MPKKFVISAELKLAGATGVRDVVRKMNAELSKVKADIKINIPNNAQNKINKLNQSLNTIATRLNSGSQAAISFNNSLNRLTGRRVTTLSRSLANVNRNIRSSVAATDTLLRRIERLGSARARVVIQIDNRALNSITQLNSLLAITEQRLRNSAFSAAQFRAALNNLATTGTQVGRTLNTVANNTNSVITANNNLTSSMTRANRAASRFNSTNNSLVKRFTAFTAVTTGIFSVIAAFRSGVSHVIDFQHGLVRMSQITGVSTKNLQGLVNNITHLSTTLGVSSQELLQLSEILAQAGLNTKEVSDAMEALALTKLAPTFGDITDTTEGLIAAMRVFDIEAKDFKETFGAVNTVAAQFAVEAEDIVVAIKRAGASFAAAGGSFNELTAAITAVRSTTRESAETISTGFRTIFARIQRPKTIQFLRDLGIELTNVNGQFVGPADAIRKLNDGLKQLSETDPRFAGIIEELGGIRQITKVIPLIQQRTVFEKALQAAIRGRGSLERDAITAQESLIVQITKLKEQFFELFRTIGDNQQFKEFVKLSLTLANSLLKVTGALTPLIPLLGALGLGRIGKSIGGGARGLLRFAGGGVVPGKGNKDSELALLTPGEVVINQKAAKNFGYGNLEKIQKFNKGGIVKGGIALAGLGLATLGGGEGNDITNTFQSTTLAVIAFGTAAAFATKQLQNAGNTAEKLNDAQKAQTKFDTIQSKGASKFATAVAERRSAQNTVDQIAVRRNRLKSVLTSGNFNPRQKAYAAAQLGQLNIDDVTAQIRLNRADNNFRDARNRLNTSGRGAVLAKRLGRARLMRGIGFGGGLLAGAGILAAGAGDAYGASADANIASGKGTTADINRAGLSAGISSSGSLGAGGAAVGSLFGPVGTVIGGLIGATYGFFKGQTDAIKDATERVRSLKFESSITDLEKTLKDALADKIVDSVSKEKVRGGINTINRSLATATNENRGEILSRSQSQASNLSEFALKLASSSKSLEDFKNASGGLGRELIYTVSALSGQSVDEFTASIKAVINDNKANADLQKSINNALLGVFKQTQQVNDLVRAFDDAGRVMDRFVNEANVIVDNFENISFTEPLSDIISQGLSANPTELSKALTQLIGGGSLTQNLTKSAADAQLLPSILRNALNAGSLVDATTGERSYGFQSSVEEQLKQAGFGPQIRDAIVENLGNFLSDDSGDQKFIEAVTKNADKFAKELTEGTQEYFDALSKAAETASRQANNILELIQKRTQAEREITSLAIGINRSGFTTRRQGAALGDTDKFTQAGNLTSNDLVRLQRQEQRIRLGRFGLGGANTSALQNRALTLQRQITGGQRQLNGINPLSVEFQKLAETIAANQKEYQEINQVLKNSADATERLTLLQDELAKAQENRVKLKDFATGLAFGGREGRQQFANDVFNARVVASNPGAIGSAEQEGSALNLLDKLIEIGAGDKGLAAFGGKSAKQVRDDRTSAFLKASGLGDSDIKTIISSSPQELQLQKDILAQQIESVTAQKAIQKIEEEKLTQLDTSIKTGFSQLIAEFQASLSTSEASRAKAEDASLGQQEIKLREQQKAFQTLSGAGLTPQSAKTIANSGGLIQTIQKQQKLRENLTNIGNRKIPLGKEADFNAFKQAAVTALGNNDIGGAKAALSNAYRAVLSENIDDKTLSEILPKLVNDSFTTEFKRNEYGQIIGKTATGIDMSPLAAVGNQYAQNNLNFEQTDLKPRLEAALGPQLAAQVMANPNAVASVVKNLDVIGDTNQNTVDQQLAQVRARRAELAGGQKPNRIANYVANNPQWMHEDIPAGAGPQIRAGLLQADMLTGGQGEDTIGGMRNEYRAAQLSRQAEYDPNVAAIKLAEEAAAFAKIMAAERAKENEEPKQDVNLDNHNNILANLGGVDNLAAALRDFVTPANDLASAIKGMPHSIEFTGSIKHEIILNGNQTADEIATILNRRLDIEGIVNKVLEQRIPGIGPRQPVKKA